MPTSNQSVSRSQIRRPKIILWGLTLVAFILLFSVILSIRSEPAHALWVVSANDDSAAQAERLLRSVSRRPAPTTLLVQSFKRDQTIGEQLGVMISLEQRQAQALPALIAALKDRNRNTRIAAMQVLGWLKSPQAVEELLNATFDPEIKVREVAIAALGEIGALQGLPRLQELQIVQSNFYLQQSAYVAEQRLVEQVAAALQLGPSEVHMLATGRANDSAYAVTANSLYALRAGVWQWVGTLPDAATGLSVGADAKLLYLATMSAGLYRSRDGGQSWEHIQFGLQAPRDITVTAVVVNPKNAGQIYLALAALEKNSHYKSPMGILASNDDGKSWSVLPDSPRDYVTTRLVFDAATTKYLYGQTGVGAWRYTLTNGRDAFAD